MSRNCPSTDSKFSEDYVASLIQQKFHEKSTKISSRDSTPAMLAELVRMFASEAATRAAQQAYREDCSVCEVEHVEKVLPQLLLDF